MKHDSFRISSIILSIVLSSFCLTSATFAATSTIARKPYNALAATLKSNTTKGVFNPATDKMRPNTIVKGVVWGVNGSTFIVRLPKDDSGYNTLITKNTVITINGKPGTARNLYKGVSVTVTGELDTSTYTLSATKVALSGKVLLAKASVAKAPIVKKAVITKVVKKPVVTKKK